MTETPAHKRWMEIHRDEQNLKAKARHALKKQDPVYSEARKARLKLHESRRRGTFGGHLNSMLKSAKVRARTRSRPFTIDYDYMHEIWPSDFKCACCGGKMQWGGARNETPTLDEVVVPRGYVKGNCAIICHRCNFQKSNSTYEELFNLCSYTQSFLYPDWGNHAERRIHDEQATQAGPSRP